MIRAATAADCAALAALDARCNPSPWRESQFQSALNGRLDTVLVDADSDGIRGFIVWQSVCGESELHLIAAAPELRRQGIATALMQQWFQTASAQGCERLFLEVRASNISAQNLYRKYGFQECGRRKGYYPLPDGGSENAVLMEKAV